MLGIIAQVISPGLEGCIGFNEGHRGCFGFHGIVQEFGQGQHIICLHRNEIIENFQLRCIVLVIEHT